MTFQLTHERLADEPAVHAEDSASGVDLIATLSGVDDYLGVPANEGSLTSFDDVAYRVAEESNTEITVEDQGLISMSAEGNPGFEVRFEDANFPLSKPDVDSPLVYTIDKHTSLVPQIKESTFRGVFVLESPAAQDEFLMTVSSDQMLHVLNAEDGGVTFVDEDGEKIGGFLAPWAKDAQNRSVPTRFVVDGFQVRQTLDLSSLKPEDFPVVADPATYVNYTTRTVVNIKNHGVVPKWDEHGKCTIKKGATCNLGKSYTVSASVQTALNASVKDVGASIGITNGASTTMSVSCSAKGPRILYLHASANKKTYQVRSVRTYGVSPQLKRETKTSPTLTAYKPTGAYVCG